MSDPVKDMANSTSKLEKSTTHIKLWVNFVEVILIILGVFFIAIYAINKIDHHIDCIAKIFTQPGPSRSKLVIPNIDQCNIRRVK